MRAFRHEQNNKSKELGSFDSVDFDFNLDMTKPSISKSERNMVAEPVGSTAPPLSVQSMAAFINGYKRRDGSDPSDHNDRGIIIVGYFIRSSS